jgi:hypothetical protein
MSTTRNPHEIYVCANAPTLRQPFSEDFSLLRTATERSHVYEGEETRIFAGFCLRQPPIGVGAKLAQAKCDDNSGAPKGKGLAQ